VTRTTRDHYHLLKHASNLSGDTVLPFINFADDCGDDERQELEALIADELQARKDCSCETPWARDRCHDLKKNFAKNFGKKLAFLTRNKAKLCKILIITIGF
jgi:hypothetical protein